MAIKLPFDEINTFIQTVIAEYARLETEERIRRTQKDVDDYILELYAMGIYDNSVMLGLPFEALDGEYLLLTVIDGKTVNDRIALHIRNDDDGRLKNLIDSELHKAYEAGKSDYASYQMADGHTVNKTWNTWLDDKVRDTHGYLEAMTVPADEEFYTYDGDHAKHPGDFALAQNNVNCRCFLTYSLG